MNQFNKIVTAAVFLSVGLYFWEVSLGSENSLAGHPGFLWAERMLAAFFTFEIFYQLQRGKKYLSSGEFWVDLVAVFPFWVGFFMPAEYLGLVRSLRVIRLFKLFWSCPTFIVITNTFKIAWPTLRAAGIAVISVCLLAAAMLYQVEPETFGHIGNAIYFAFTTSVTVGFGDYSPVTPLGKIITMVILYGPALLLCGAVVGVIGAAYNTAIEKHESN